jgi:hypothetical protein
VAVSAVAHRAGSLRPSSTPLDTPRRKLMSIICLKKKTTETPVVGLTSSSFRLGNYSVVSVSLQLLSSLFQFLLLLLPRVDEGMRLRAILLTISVRHRRRK